MCGILNKVIHGLVTENYVEETWNKTKKDRSIDIDYILSNESYDDSITYKFAGSASKILNKSIKEVLIAFGEYWIIKTGQSHYGSLMQSGGNSSKKFIINLPHFYSRVSLIYPNRTPVEFTVTNVKETSLKLYYYSTRIGLTYFVIGLLRGINKMFKERVTIEILERKDQGLKHHIFELK